MARHPGVENALRWLEPNLKLPDHLRDISAITWKAAIEAVNMIPVDSPELTSGLNMLVQVKDHLVRAAIIAEEAQQ